MKKPFKDFFYFSIRERRGVLILTIGIIIAFLIGHFYVSSRQQQAFEHNNKQQQALVEKEHESFIDSIEEQKWQRKKEFRKQNYKKVQSFNLRHFDPNTADSSTFISLGLPEWVAQNILRYREAGGQFRKAEDLSKIYKLSKEHFQMLLPYVVIEQKDSTKHQTRLYHPPTIDSSDKNRQEAIYKYKAGTVIDLNLADTTELKKIPGIGSGIARMITGYRQRLGGFYCIEQLKEINIDYHQLESWLCVSANDIQRININKASIERLYNHPYINFYQAKILVEYRKDKGVLHSLKPFMLYSEFSEDDLKKIGHYIRFE